MQLRNPLSISRSCKLCSLLAVVLCLATTVHSLAQAPAQDFQQAHRDAVNRQRRIIYNNDGAETAIYMTEPTAENFLEQRTTALAGTAVDSIFYCSRSCGFGVFTHGTEIGDVFTTKEGRYENNVTGEMLAAGLDPLQLMVDFAHEHGIELFWSMRMNDTHDAQRSAAADIIYRASTLKTSHPEYLLGTSKKRPKYGAWTAVNFARPEIRDLAVRYFEEVCQRYDVDGVELDFFRHPVYFPSTARGKKATAEELAAMTDMVRQIREMTQREGQKRGRPILVAVHCPDSVEYSRAMGLAIDQWMEQGLLDLWIAGGTFQLNDWAYSVGVARQHGVKVYPSLDNNRVKDDQAKQMRNTAETYRARGSNALAAGADGVCLFNFFGVFDPKAPKHNLFNELADAEKLATLDRDYFASSQGMVRSASGNYPLESFQNTETLNGRNPKQVKPGTATDVKLYVQDAPFSDPAPKLTLRLRFEKLRNAETLQVRLNGAELKPTKTSDQWVDYPVAADDVVQGSNQIQVSLMDTAEKPWKLIDCVLNVRFDSQ